MAGRTVPIVFGHHYRRRPASNRPNDGILRQLIVRGWHRRLPRLCRRSRGGVYIARRIAARPVGVYLRGESRCEVIYCGAPPGGSVRENEASSGAPGHCVFGEPVIRQHVASRMRGKCAGRSSQGPLGAGLFYDTAIPMVQYHQHNG